MNFSSDFPHQIGPYTFSKYIGEGRNGSHALYTKSNNNSLFFFKILKKSIFENQSKLLQYKEKIYKLMEHNAPNLLKYEDFYEDDSKFYIVTKYCSKGNIGKLILSKGSMSEQVARSVFKQLFTSLNYLHHNLHIAHRDIKVENIVIDSDFTPYFTDFDYAALTDSKGYALNHQSKTDKDVCGTFLYNAPEILKSKDGNYNLFSADIWSLGVVLYTAIAGQLPWNATGKETIEQQIEKGEYPNLSTFSMELVDLLSILLQTDPKARATYDVIVSHPWFVKERKTPWYSSSAAIIHVCDTLIGSNHETFATTYPRHKESRNVQVQHKRIPLSKTRMGGRMDVARSQLIPTFY